MNRITIAFLVSLWLVPVGGAIAQVYENPYEQSTRNLEQRQQVERDRSADFQRQMNQATTDQQRMQALDNNAMRQNREENQQFRKEMDANQPYNPYNNQPRQRPY